MQNAVAGDCDEPDATLAIASLPLDQPQRARFADIAARLQHVGHGAELHGERPAEERDQHHARRHEHPGQLPENLRRLLRAVDAVDRLRRGSDGHDGGEHRRLPPARAASRSSSSPSPDRTRGPAPPTSTARATRSTPTTWFRNRDLPPDPKTGKAPKDQLRNYQQGIAQGGPILKNKAFFFFNYEEQRAPSSSTLQRVVLTPDAAERRLQLQHEQRRAARRTCSSSRRPTGSSRHRRSDWSRRCSPTFRTRRRSTGSLAALSNPLVQQYTFSTPTRASIRSPTVRIDYELSQRHRLTGSFNYRHINSTPDTTNNAQVPFPACRRPAASSRRAGRRPSRCGRRSAAAWSTSSASAAPGGATLFSPELGPSMFDGTGGMRLNFIGRVLRHRVQLTNLASGVTNTGLGHGGQLRA